MNRLLTALTLYGMLNAAAYSCLLPLWEGFDEGFHYGYVQSVSTSGQLQALGKTALSKEVWHAYESTPVSHYLQGYTHAPINFSDYFKMTEDARAAMRSRLESLPAGEKFEPQPGKPNYEVNQAPLPYLFMAIIDRALWSASLPARVLWLRLICSALAALLLARATMLVGQEIALPAIYVCAALFCTFSSQMLLAVISHVSNDCFAVPAFGFLLWVSLRAARTAAPRDCFRMSLAMAAALLIKAYFLFLIPLPAVIFGWALFKKRLPLKSALWCALPMVLLVAPWYARNLVLYNNLSGTVESTSGLGIGKAIETALRMPWGESIRYLAYSSLWTGNNSFTTFSVTTLNIALLLLAIGAVMYLLRARWKSSEVALPFAIVLFCGGVAVISVAFYSSSKGAMISAVPWYQQVLVMPVMMLVFLGAHRWGRVGTVLCAAVVLIWTYLLLATYWVKLVPLYGGFPQGPTKFRPLLDWYLNESSARDSVMRTMELAPLGVLWTLLGMSSVCALTLSWILISRGKKFA